MKKIQTLLGGVFFLGMMFFLSNIQPVKIEKTFSEQYKEDTKQYYEIDLTDMGITTSNLEKHFPNAIILKAFPLFSSIYADQIYEKYYSFNPLISIRENSKKMEEYYFNLLEQKGFIHDQQHFSIHGIPIFKIIVELNVQEKQQIQKKYSICKDPV